MDIPQNLIPIFLSAKMYLDSKDECLISKRPLVEPIKLHCGHVFNASQFLHWYENHKVCPLDGKEISINEISFDEDVFARVKKNCFSNLLTLKSEISELDSKVIHLRLDDRAEELMTLSTIANQVGSPFY